MLDHKPGLGGSPYNKDVIASLEAILSIAKRGLIQHAIIITADTPTQNSTTIVGNPALSFSGLGGMEAAKIKLLGNVYGGHSEEPAVDQGADRVQYSQSDGPACYDFIPWMINAEMRRIRMGYPGPLKIGFSIRPGDHQRTLYRQTKKKFFDNVIYPSMQFIGAVRDQTAATAPPIIEYTMVPIVKASRAGEFVPVLSATAEAREVVAKHLGIGKPPVTITLREAPYWEYRNSNVPEWIKVADYLKEKGERVIFLRDTDKASVGIPGHTTYPLASNVIDVRMALYETARCNLFVSNGPWHLAVFSQRPWLMFVEPDDDAIFAAETPQWWKQRHGIDPHTEQFPWSMETQRIVPKRDLFETIIEEWERLKLDD